MNTKITKILFTISVLLLTSNAIAQNTGFPDDVVDNSPTSPIDSYVIVAMLIGLVGAYFHFRKIVSTKNVGS